MICFSYQEYLCAEKMKTKNDITVKNWLELQRLLFENSWDENILRYRSPYAFRGLSDRDYDLKTSLMRLGGKYEDMERHLLRNFRKYAPKGTLDSDLIWDWLAVAQHHGLPTRMLDWTYSPYIALHFVTDDLGKYNEDGAIWCMNYMKANEYLPGPLRSVLRQESSLVFTGEMLESVCRGFSELERLKSSDDEFVVFLEPPSFDERIINQYALFCFMSSARAILNEWLDNHPELFFRIIIPAKLKWEIRDKLDEVNITERVLFPGLDGLSAWLRRYYRPPR